MSEPLEVQDYNARGGTSCAACLMAYECQCPCPTCTGARRRYLEVPTVLRIVRQARAEGWRAAKQAAVLTCLDYAEKAIVSKDCVEAARWCSDLIRALPDEPPEPKSLPTFEDMRGILKDEPPEP